MSRGRLAQCHGPVVHSVRWPDLHHHREAQARPTRAGGGGWQAKGIAYLVCVRCGGLH